MSQTTVLMLDGLSCGHCIKRVKETLEQRNDVQQAEVSLNEARVTGDATSEALVSAIEQAGYHARVKTETTHPKSNPLTVKENQPEVLTAETQQLLAEDTEESTQLLIDGMSCASCVSRVENALKQVDGVQQAHVNLAERSALILGSAPPQALVAAVEQAGYGAEVTVDEAERREKQQRSARRAIRRFSWQSALALLLGVPLMIYGLFGDNMMLTDSNRNGWLIVGVLTLLMMIVAGGHFYRGAWRSLMKGVATMDTLVALGTAAAWCYSITVNLWPATFPMDARHLYYEASTMIIGLINLGHALEQRARQRSSKALERLLDLTPPTARVVTRDGETTLPLSEVQPGMVLRLATGDRVPVDGEITQGEAWLNEAMLTGEPVPQQKSSGDTLHAGTLIQQGSVLFRARVIGKHTTLARIIRLVRRAQSSKTQPGQLADRISAVFVPGVILVALVSATVWYFIGPQPHIVYTLVVATTVLIIACPCALGLATPMSIIAGIGRAAEFGVLVRDADALQRASSLDTLVFDKTGTLTEGTPDVTAITTFNHHDQAQVIRWAAALEQGASHPLARAITQYAQDAALPLTTQFRTFAGQGVSGTIDGLEMLLGNRLMLQQQGVVITEAETLIQQHAECGATPVMLAVNGKLAALLAIQDPLRKESVAALKRLHAEGYRLLMLTGDNVITARAIAREAGLDEVIAGVLPEGKAQAIIDLQQQGHHVAMIGDGINDAPALAQADVGIAMGNGSDVAIETAAMTLMRHDLNGVVDALAIAKATLRNMKQNLSGAFVYNLLGIPIAAGVLYPLTGTLLSPIFAGAAMALSSITVVSNANRLLHYQPPGR